MTWLEKFVDTVISAPWVADVVQSALGAGIAFVGAYFLFRRQLRHDREQTAKQIAAEASARFADRQSAAAEALGRDLLEAVQDLTRLDMVDLAEALRKDYNPPSHGRIKRALATAELLLDLDNLVSGLWHEHFDTWGAMRGAVVRNPRQVPEFVGIEDVALGSAIDEMMYPLVEKLEFVAREFIRWDGTASPPGAGVLNDWSLDGAPDSSQVRTPHDVVRERFLASLLKESTRRKR